MLKPQSIDPQLIRSLQLAEMKDFLQQPTPAICTILCAFSTHWATTCSSRTRNVIKRAALGAVSSEGFSPLTTKNLIPSAVSASTNLASRAWTREAVAVARGIQCGSVSGH